MNRPDWLLLSRFRLHLPALTDLRVATFDFVWQPALTAFLSRVASERGKAIRDDEWPPFRRLNDALVALSPRFVHGFENIGWEDGQPLRQILACVGDDPETLPTAAQLQHVVMIWALHWAQARFASFFTGAGQGLGLLERLQQDIAGVMGAWQYHQAATLWADPTDELRFRAIPSLLAAHLHGRTCTIGNYEVQWQLCQTGGRHLMVVSAPQTSSFTQRDGTATQSAFAYAIDFAVQTQAGSQEPWIHLYASCRRYLEIPAKRVNYGRDVTVLVGTGSPRLQAWDIEPTLVRLHIHASPRLETVEWADRLPELLAQLHARDLADPRAILKAPQQYRSPTQHPFGDTYLPLFAEGMRPKHALKTGFSAEENSQIIQTLTQEFAGLLRPASPLQRDPVTMKPRRTLALQSPDRVRQRMKDEYPAHIVSRLRLANDQRPLVVLVCWQHETTRDAVLEQLRQLLGVAADAPWPEGVTVMERRVPFAWVELLDPGTLKPSDCYNKQRPPNFFSQWHTQMRRAHYERQRLWENQVWSTLVTPDDTVRLALIEIPDFTKSDAPEEQWPRDAIRASVLLNWHGTAQFLRPMIRRINPKTQQEELRGESKGRLMNAVNDLIIRHTATVFDTLVPVYEREAGLPGVLASQLLVTGLYRIRRYKTDDAPAADYALAARLFPNGKVLMRIPSSRATGWIPAHEANLLLGEMRARGRSFQLTPAELLAFARDIILEETAQPHLVLVMADQWRNRVWPQLQNRRLLRVHELDLNLAIPGELPSLRTITPGDRLNLRVIRLRRRGTLGETPQYIATQGEAGWEGVSAVKLVRAAAGFIDTAGESAFFQYLSIADLPDTARKQDGQTTSPKHGEGGGLAFKYQTVLEIVPFFFQETDDPQAWARVPHSLRHSPAWGEGGLVMPYPLHIAAKMIANYVPMTEGSEE